MTWIAPAVIQLLFILVYLLGRLILSREADGEMRSKPSSPETSETGIPLIMGLVSILLGFPATSLALILLWK